MMGMHVASLHDWRTSLVYDFHQVTAFLSGVFRGKPSTSAIVIVPVSLMPTWQAEIKVRKTAIMTE
jgi:hypothetical protein